MQNKKASSMVNAVSKSVLGTAALAALALGAALSAVPAAAQQAAAPAAAEPTIPEGPWLKVCSTDAATSKQTCVVTQELRAESGAFIASVTLRQVTGETALSVIVAVPPGVLLQPGLATKVDNNAQTDVKYEICFPNACYARRDSNMDFVAQLKRGNQLAIQAINQQGQPLTFNFTLTGFTRTYDGEGLNAEAAQARQDQLNQALQARAEQARQRLIDQQRAAQAGAAPAAPPNP